MLFLLLFAQTVSAQIAPGMQQSAAQTATITGTVERSDGMPVAGADVRLNGSGARLTTVSDAHGMFSFISVPYGTYHIDVTAKNLGTASRDAIVLKGDITLAIQYTVQTVGGLKTIAQVATRSSGAQINVTSASIASVMPSEYAFKGNPLWRELLEQVPGVTVGGGQYGGGTVNVVIPDSPFQPIILSINGALPYETSTTFDGMPLSNYTFSSTPGNGVDLSSLPMALFETADVVRGPGANAPSIVDSVGGAFVLHAPGAVEKDSFEASVSNDPYGGYFSNMKAMFRRGKLSGTVVYDFNNSPGPLGSGPFFGGVTFPATINGNDIASGGQLQYVSNPIYGQCYCIIQTTLVGSGGYQSTAWSQHNGGFGLSYQVAPTITAQVFYAGSQATAAQAGGIDTFLFTPNSSYTGPLAPGSYPGRSVYSTTIPILESGSLLEEKVTAYLGRGVLRLAALQNYTYSTQLYPYAPPSNVQLYGTGAYCTNLTCTTTTPFVFTGQTATVTFSSFTYFFSGRSTNDDLLGSYEMQIGSKSNLGVSFVKSANSATCFYNEAGISGGTPYSFGGGLPVVTETTNEFRVHAGTQLSNALSLDSSYYFARGAYHVPDPNNPNQWVDSIFPYSAPRLGLTWRMTRDTVLRAAAGGGFALPPLLNLVGANGPPVCSPTSCTVSLTNINLQPEKSFGFDIGTDMRLRHDTALSADVYRTDLYGQLFQSVNFIGVDPTFHLPTYAQEYLNLAHSRFEGVNISLRHDVPRGMYWDAGLGLTRGYIVSVPAGFYDQAGTTCNFATGGGCQNTYAIPNQNFNGEYQSTVPYANGSATFGYRWAAKKYVDIQATYQGNNNAYFQPAFIEFDAHAGYPLTKSFALIATLRNITGIHDQNYQFSTVNPNLIAPSIAGREFPLYPIPYGPRTLIVTASFKY